MNERPNSSCGVRDVLRPLVAIRHCAVNPLHTCGAKDGNTTMNEQRGGVDGASAGTGNNSTEGRIRSLCQKLRVEGGAVGRPRAGGRRSHVSLPCFMLHTGYQQTHVCRCRRRRRRACAAAAAAARRAAPILPLSRGGLPRVQQHNRHRERAGGRELTCKHTAAWQRQQTWNLHVYSGEDHSGRQETRGGG